MKDYLQVEKSLKETADSILKSFYEGKSIYSIDGYDLQKDFSNKDYYLSYEITDNLSLKYNFTRIQEVLKKGKSRKKESTPPLNLVYYKLFLDNPVQSQKKEKLKLKKYSISFLLSGSYTIFWGALFLIHIVVSPELNKWFFISGINLLVGTVWLIGIDILDEINKLKENKD